MIEETAVPFPYNVILGRETALPSPDCGNINNSDATGFDMKNQNPKLSRHKLKSYFHLR